MRIAIPLFSRVTALDAIGPYEVLQRVPDFDITFVGEYDPRPPFDAGSVTKVGDVVMNRVREYASVRQ